MERQKQRSERKNGVTLLAVKTKGEAGDQTSQVAQEAAKGSGVHFVFHNRLIRKI